MYFVHSLLHLISFQRDWLVGTKVASLTGIRPDGGAGCKGTHGHAFVHIHAHTPARKHTCTHTCGHTSTACVCICSSRFLEPLSPTPFLATCRGNFSYLVVEMVTCVASWCDCTSKQSRYVQLSVREDSENLLSRICLVWFPFVCVYCVC